jgi:hypothetical protein
VSFFEFNTIWRKPIISNKSDQNLADSKPVKLPLSQVDPKYRYVDDISPLVKVQIS